MGDYIVSKLVVGSYGTNCYVIKDKNSRDACVIDPGGDLTLIQNELHELDASCRVILLTHGHFDHILALGDLRSQRTVVCIHQKDAHYLTERDMFSSMIPFDPRPFAEADFFFTKEGKYKVDNFEFYVMPTPGHTPGSVCYIFDDMMFSGDTLFAGSVGTTDFGGDRAQMSKTLAGLSRLPGDYELLPGHGPSSTLSEEKRNNPYLKTVQ